MTKKGGAVLRLLTPEARLKREVRQQLRLLGFKKGKNGVLLALGQSKDSVRQLHSEQRAEKLRTNALFLERNTEKLLGSFADGDEIDPRRIRLTLRRVRSDTREADLFRLATLTWSVPVSAGFGRRLRYLVWDEGHDCLAGIIALGDPVFNLSVRDKVVGWTTADRSQRLVHLLDAYVLGAVPPYSFLLGGKAVAALVRTREVVQDFKDAYGDTTMPTMSQVADPAGSRPKVDPSLNRRRRARKGPSSRSES